MKSSLPNKAYLSLGSNIEPERHLETTLALLERFGVLQRISSVYESDAVGEVSQSRFLNVAVLLRTAHSAESLKEHALSWIEEVLGRQKSADINAPRCIDVDITLFNRQVTTEAACPIPDPNLLEHAFVAIPLAEIAPDYVHPVVGQTMTQIAQRFEGGPEVVRIRADLSLTPPGTRVGEPTGLSNGGLLGGDEGIQESIRVILRSMGEDPAREGLVHTPDRMARMYAELTSGYGQDVQRIINDALFDVTYDEMVIVKDIDYYSLCEHHLLPFFGRAHVGYIPADKVVGLSKIPRIVEMFSRRLQLQERMTRQIADCLEDALCPAGVAVVIEGTHMCSIMRGVKKDNIKMVTSTMLGSFRENAKTRAEFMALLGLKTREE